MSDESKEVTIVVNGRQRTVAKNSELTVAQVVALAFDNPPTGENVEFTITYRKGGNEHRPEGSMSGNDTVKVKEGTVFNVTATDKS
ncbi:MAG TPA: multiubiquitin domain-containing protein [Candidatus Paceibacterota bacterium]|nr:multiubiquitin domain-containing protein [Candidatus Paceibacterota bacterium]